MIAARLLAVGAFALCAPHPAGAALRAVIIGVNAYRFETPLKGAVNDADAVAAAIAPVAASITRLTDGEVEHDAVLRALSNILVASKPGDTVFVAYSGHGGRERVRITPDTPSGYREFWVMADFDRHTPSGLARRVLSSELRDWLARAHAAGVRVILLADHCYSGKIYRLSGVDVSRVRSIPTLTAPDVPPGETPPVGELKLAPPPPGLVSLAADTADKPVAEFRISADRKIHGALSFAFTYALTAARAELDPAGGGRVTVAALETFLGRAVNLLTEGQQYPQLRTGEPEDSVLFTLPGVRSPTDTPADAPVPPEPVALHVDGVPVAEAQALVAQIPDAIWAAGPAQARLVEHYRPGGSRLVTGLNMVVHFDLPQAKLPAVIQKIQAVDALMKRTLKSTLVIEARRSSGAPADLFFSHEEIAIRVRTLPGPHLVVFDLDPEGTVISLFPRHGDAPIAWPATAVDVLQTEIAPVFGGEHLVAVASTQPLDRLLARIRDLHGKQAAMAAHTAVAEALDADPAAQVAVAGVFTADAALRCDTELIRNAAMLAACPVRKP